MLHLETIADVRAACDAARGAGRTVGLVPTMGYLHEGHRSLMRAARAANDLVVVTIFVNPLQFGANEDLDRYPRDLSGDLAQCADEGVDIVFAPSEHEMYPNGAPVTTVHVAELTAELCGRARPTHFDGVTTVVTKLFSIIGPCRAYFGRKDAQQLAVIARMAADLNLPVEVIGCPLVREPDGLALSSRNAYLSDDQRRAAVVLSRALTRAAESVIDGERDTATVIQAVGRIIASEPAVALEYAEARDARALTSVGHELQGDVLLAVAARVGDVRLIDNVMISIGREGATVDLGIQVGAVCNAR
jgi:pantoate--beta-alanine ligase